MKKIKTTCFERTFYRVFFNEEFILLNLRREAILSRLRFSLPTFTSLKILSFTKSSRQKFKTHFLWQCGKNLSAIESVLLKIMFTNRVFNWRLLHNELKVDRKYWSHFETRVTNSREGIWSPHEFTTKDLCDKKVDNSSVWATSDKTQGVHLTMSLFFENIFWIRYPATYSVASFWIRSFGDSDVSRHNSRIAVCDASRRLTQREVFLSDDVGSSSNFLVVFFSHSTDDWKRSITMRSSSFWQFA